MTARVPNPNSGTANNVATLKPLGAVSYVTAGTYQVQPPVGTKFIRFDLRGGGGGGGAQINNKGGAGGGQGGLTRFAIPHGPSTFPVTIGAAGAGGTNSNTGARAPDGGDTYTLNLMARGGQGGGSDTGSAGAGGPGVNGPEPLAGFGAFSGANGGGTMGGGGNYLFEDNPPTLVGSGIGGVGAQSRTAALNGGPGGSGHAYIEFFG